MKGTVLPDALRNNKGSSPYRVFLLLVVLGFTSRLRAENPAASNPPAAGSAILLLDDLYTQRGVLKTNQNALGQCEAALAHDSRNVDLLWRCSRAAWWVGTQQSKRSDRLLMFKKGMAYGEQAVALRPDSVPAHFWLGGNYSSYGSAKGAFTSLSLIHSIRREMEIVLKLQPTYMGGGADRILGILDYKVPAVIGGSKSRGLAHLRRALDLDPHNPVTIYYLADYYAAVGNPAKANEYLARLGDLTPSPDFKAEMPLMQRQAKELMAQLAR